MGVIPPAFTSWSDSDEETDVFKFRDAGSRISLLAVSWSGSLATVWGISKRVVFWLWWQNSRESNWCNRKNWVKRTLNSLIASSYRAAWYSKSAWESRSLFCLFHFKLDWEESRLLIKSKISLRSLDGEIRERVHIENWKYMGHVTVPWETF